MCTMGFESVECGGVNGILERQFGVYGTSFVSSIHKLENLFYLAGTDIIVIKGYKRSST